MTRTLCLILFSFLVINISLKANEKTLITKGLNPRAYITSGNPNRVSIDLEGFYIARKVDIPISGLKRIAEAGTYTQIKGSINLGEFKNTKLVLLHEKECSGENHVRTYGAYLPETEYSNEEEVELDVNFDMPNWPVSGDCPVKISEFHFYEISTDVPEHLKPNIEIDLISNPDTSFNKSYPQIISYKGENYLIKEYSKNTVDRDISHTKKDVNPFIGTGTNVLDGTVSVTLSDHQEPIVVIYSWRCSVKTGPDIWKEYSEREIKGIYIPEKNSQGKVKVNVKVYDETRDIDPFFCRTVGILNYEVFRLERINNGKNPLPYGPALKSSNGVWVSPTDKYAHESIQLSKLKIIESDVGEKRSLQISNTANYSHYIIGESSDLQSWTYKAVDTTDLEMPISDDSRFYSIAPGKIYEESEQDPDNFWLDLTNFYSNEPIPRTLLNSSIFLGRNQDSRRKIAVRIGGTFVHSQIIKLLGGDHNNHQIFFGDEISYQFESTAQNPTLELFIWKAESSLDYPIDENNSALAPHLYSGIIDFSPSMSLPAKPIDSLGTNWKFVPENGGVRDPILNGAINKDSSALNGSKFEFTYYVNPSDSHPETIKSFEGIQNYPEIEELTIQSGYRHLGFIFVNGNILDPDISFNPVGELPNLEKLSIRTRTTRLDLNGEFVALKHLEIDHTDLKDLEIPDKLSGLNTLIIGQQANHNNFLTLKLPEEMTDISSIILRTKINKLDLPSSLPNLEQLHIWELGSDYTLTLPPDINPTLDIEIVVKESLKKLVLPRILRDDSTFKIPTGVENLMVEYYP